MASIVREPNGRKTIQFIAPDGKKRSKVRLGEYLGSKITARKGR